MLRCTDPIDIARSVQAAWTAHAGTRKILSEDEGRVGTAEKTTGLRFGPAEDAAKTRTRRTSSPRDREEEEEVVARALRDGCRRDPPGDRALARAQARPRQTQRSRTSAIVRGL